MEFYNDSRSDGAQKFDHLADKVRRSVIFFEKAEEEMSSLHGSLRDLRFERNDLAAEIALLNRQLAKITAENVLTHEKAAVLMERLDEFLGDDASASREKNER